MEVASAQDKHHYVAESDVPVVKNKVSPCDYNHSSWRYVIIKSLDRLEKQEAPSGAIFSMTLTPLSLGWEGSEFFRAVSTKCKNKGDVPLDESKMENGQVHEI